MSVISSIKKAFGFPDEYDEDIDQMIARDNEQSPIDQIVSEQIGNDVNSTDTASAESDTAIMGQLPGEIFDAVIELFNSLQPDFVKECLDVDKQRVYLLERIDTSLRKKLQEQTQAAIEQGRRQWMEEKRRMAQEVEKLKSDYHSLKQQREEFQNQQLSAARQKRAMSERIHDLENKVNSLEAEKEQFLLENRSMANKLRVANVKSSTADTEDSTQRIDELAKANVELQDTIEQSKVRISQLETQLNEAQTAGSEEFTSEQQAMMEEMEKQLSKFESIKKNKDARIAELKAQLAEATSSIVTLKEETESLRETIKTNLHTHATSQSAMQEEIKRLTAMVESLEPNSYTEPAPTYTKSEPEQESTPEPAIDAEDNTIIISAIDELMDSTDWFQAPEPTPLKKDPALEEEFGYKEPVKKPTAHHDDDKQLSLF